MLDLDRDGNERRALQCPDVLTDWTGRFVAQHAPAHRRRRTRVTDVLVDVEHNSYAVFTPQADGVCGLALAARCCAGGHRPRFSRWPTGPVRLEPEALVA